MIPFWTPRGIYVVCRTCGHAWVLADRDLQAYCGACGHPLREEVEFATQGNGGWYWSLYRIELIGVATMLLAIGLPMLIGTALRPVFGDDLTLMLMWPVLALVVATYLYRSFVRSKRRRRPADGPSPDLRQGHAPPTDLVRRARRRPTRAARGRARE
jgi:hypothetical protein